MRIIVPIKQVPETKSVKMDEKTGTVIRDGVESIINPLDLYAIEIAVQLKESNGGEVIAISMGPPKAIEALRESIAMGVDSAVLVSDRAFAGSDTWATSYVLAEAIRKIGDYDLIICGERATDGDTGQVGPEIASYLQLPVVSYVNKVNKIVNGVIGTHRLVEEGSEMLESEMPCLLTVVKEVSDPRLPTLRGKQKARKAVIPVCGIKDLNLDSKKVGLAGSPTKVVKIFRPKVARECEKIIARDEDKIKEAVGKLEAFLKKKEIL
ncbi:MAG: electron transfer flavoprotein subunit beta/FixA family protein [Victivallales bacterium]